LQRASAQNDFSHSGLKEPYQEGGTRLEKIMKSMSRTHKASLQGMATGTSVLLVFAVSLVTSGFVLSANANERKAAIITFDVPGATHGTFQGTHGNAISPQGTITGFFDSNGNHGFVRPRDGTFTTFDAPGASTGSGQGTFPGDITPARAIAGSFLDASNAYHGFLLEGE
jgi:hypothetical protein